MMASAIAWLVAKGLSERAAKAALIGVTLIAVLAALGTAKCAYDRSVIERHVVKQESKQIKRERKADRNLNEQKARDQAEKAEREKEIDDATQGIHDQAPSARQRARACVELRRQARAEGRLEPAC